MLGHSSQPPRTETSAPTETSLNDLLGVTPTCISQVDAGEKSVGMLSSIELVSPAVMIGSSPGVSLVLNRGCAIYWSLTVQKDALLASQAPKELYESLRPSLDAPDDWVLIPSVTDQKVCPISLLGLVLGSRVCDLSNPVIEGESLLLWAGFKGVFGLNKYVNVYSEC